MRGTGLRSTLGMAMGILLGQAHTPPFRDLSPTIKNSTHRTAGGTRRGRSMVSRWWYASQGNCYAGVSNGARECARRRKQIAADKIGCRVYPA